jgi:hypothetical protein
MRRLFCQLPGNSVMRALGRLFWDVRYPERIGTAHTAENPLHMRWSLQIGIVQCPARTVPAALDQGCLSTEPHASPVARATARRCSGNRLRRSTRADGVAPSPYLCTAAVVPATGTSSCAGVSQGTPPRRNRTYRPLRTSTRSERMLLMRTRFLNTPVLVFSATARCQAFRRNGPGRLMILTGTSAPCEKHRAESRQSVRDGNPAAKGSAAISAVVADPPSQTTSSSRPPLTAT